MTIEEAKKIIEMCADAVKKGDGDDAKIYVNKEYVLSILDMVSPQTVYPWPDYPQNPVYPWNPVDQGITWKDRFIYKKTTDGTGDDAPGKWVPAPDNPKPWEPWRNDPNSTGYYPGQPEVHVSCDDTAKFAKSDSSEFDTSGITTTCDDAKYNNMRYSLERDMGISHDKPVDISPKRTDFIEDFVPNGTVSK